LLGVLGFVIVSIASFFLPPEYLIWEVLLLIFLLFIFFFYCILRWQYYRKLKLLDPEHKLFKDLGSKAPGTYQHSLQLSTLALYAARNFPEIDLLDLRLGCLLHDIGKLRQPEYFTENQEGDEDKFGDKHVERRRELILRHSLDGLEIAKDYKVPKDLWHYIETHHGTSLTGFYYRLKEHDAEAREEDYRYPGPKPKTLEAAILMLADSVEAATRSKAGKELKVVVDKVFREKEEDGQLDEVGDLTYEKLDIIKKAFLEVLKTVYHERVERDDEKTRTTIS